MLNLKKLSLYVEICGKETFIDRNDLKKKYYQSYATIR